MAIIFFIIIAALFAYLLYDYLMTSRNEQMLERLNFGFEDKDQVDPSLWDGASGLLQLESVRNLLYKSALTRAFDIRLKRSGINISLLQGIALLFILTINIAVLAYLYFKIFYVSVGVLVAFPIVFWLILSALARRQQAKLDNQLPSLINSLLTTMRAGGTPTQALRSSSENASNPLRDSVADVLNNLQIGRSPNAVWKEWSDFWGTKSTRLLATGIRVKWEAGGQMSSVLEHIQETLEFNKRIEQRVSALTVQAKFGSWILSLIPALLAYLQYRVKPSLVEDMLVDPIGQYLYMAAGALTVFGFLWLRKLSKLKM